MKPYITELLESWSVRSLALEFDCKFRYTGYTARIPVIPVIPLVYRLYRLYRLYTAFPVSSNKIYNMILSQIFIIFWFFDTIFLRNLLLWLKFAKNTLNENIYNFNNMFCDQMCLFFMKRKFSNFYFSNNIAVCNQIDITDHISYSKKLKKLFFEFLK